MNDDPSRLSRESDPLGRLFARAENDLLEESRVERVALAVAPVLTASGLAKQVGSEQGSNGAGEAAAANQGAASQGAASQSVALGGAGGAGITLAKGALLLGAVGLASVSAWVLGGTDTSKPAPASTAPSVQPELRAPTPPGKQVTDAPATTLPVHPGSPQEPPAAAVETPAVSATERGPTRAARAPGPERRKASGPNVRGAQTAQGSTVSPAADSPQPAPAVGSRGEDDASPSIRPTDQLRLLTQARALLTRRPGRSLELLDIHQRHFPDTVLDQERAALRVEALWRSGQNAAARRARTSFSTRYPNSPHSTRLEQLLDRR